MIVDLKKALAAQVILLYGTEEVLKYRILADAKEVLGVDSDDSFDYQEFQADQVSPVEWFASACTIPFLSQRRVVVVRNILRLDPERLGQADLSKVPPSGLLILVADSQAESEESSRKRSFLSGWESAVKASKGFLAKVELPQGEQSAVLKADAQKAGKSMQETVARLLLETTGSLSEALLELEKVIIFAGDRTAISESDVKAVAMQSKEFNVYKAMDAMMDGRSSEALQQMKIMLSGDGKITDAMLKSVIPTFSKSLKNTWQARTILEAGGSAFDVPNSAGPALLSNPNWEKEKEWSKKRHFKWAKALTFEQIASCIESVADSDAKLKGLIDTINADAIVDDLVFEICQIVKPSVFR